jgi:hypothetical protein
MDEQELLEEMQNLQKEEAEDQQDEQQLDQDAWKEAYGYPEPEEKHGSHEFISKSVFELPDVEKATFLNESELGRPLFNVRFLLDMEDISRYYIDPLAKVFMVENKIANYFREKIVNVCSSGLSNQGFIQNMNVTRKVDMTKKRVRNPIENLKGGKK